MFPLKSCSPCPRYVLFTMSPVSTVPAPRASKINTQYLIHIQEALGGDSASVLESEPNDRKAGTAALAKAWGRVRQPQACFKQGRICPVQYKSGRAGSSPTSVYSVRNSSSSLSARMPQPSTPCSNGVGHNRAGHDEVSSRGGPLPAKKIRCSSNSNPRERLVELTADADGTDFVIAKVRKPAFLAKRGEKRRHPNHHGTPPRTPQATNAAAVSSAVFRQLKPAAHSIPACLRLTRKDPC